MEAARGIESLGGGSRGEERRGLKMREWQLAPDSLAFSFIPIPLPVPLMNALRMYMSL
jgi:hypothetical protein